MITLVAKIKAKKGSEKALEGELLELIKKVEEEAETLQYVLHRSLKDPCAFMFYEIYKDKEALAAHSVTDHFKQTMKTIFPYLEGPADIETYQELGRINR